ncbi:PP2C family protein-serine/threonine phosphatase [Deltaproteobacteria bacterium TL4]
MLKSRFLRNLLLLSLGSAIIPAIFNVLYIYPSFSTLLMENTEDEAIRTSNHLISSLHLDEMQIHKGSFGGDFSELVEVLKKDVLFMKIKVFSKTGEVLFSTESKDLGEMNNKSYFHDIVMNGYTYTKIVPKNKKSLEDQIVTIDVVETYVPIMKADQFIGAFELYYDITSKKEKIDKLLWVSWLTLFMMSLLLMLAFAWSVWRLDVLITRQKLIDEELKEHNDRMQEELSLAGEFQRKILPQIHHFPHLKISTKYLPHAEVSGDTYDFSFDCAGTMSFFLGDATGHGVSAAFMTMMLQISLDNVKHDLPTDEAIRGINTLLASRETGKFVTGIYLRITPDGLLSASNAAHPPLIIIPHNQGELVLLEKRGSLIGAFAQELVPYVEEKYQLQPNDRIFAYTDGIIEWDDLSEKRFGLDRLIDFIKKHNTSDSDTLLNTLLEHLDEFAQGKACNDDLTMFIFEFLGKTDQTQA